jgi:hypothetical protein
VLGTKGHSKTRRYFEKCTICMLTAGMPTRAVARELNGDFSTISHQRHFREFGTTSNRRQRVWCRVGERFADVDVVNSAP